MNSLLKSLQQRFRTQPTGKVLRELASQVCVNRFQVWRLAKLTVPQARDTAVQCFSDDLPRLRALRETRPDLPVDFVRDAIDAPSSFVAAEYNGSLAGICWAYGHDNPGHFLIMEPGDFEIRSVFVTHEARGLGIAKLVMAGLCEHLQRRKANNIICVVHADNVAKQHADKAIGFELLAEWGRLPLLGRRYIISERRLETWAEWARSFLRKASQK